MDHNYFELLVASLAGVAIGLWIYGDAVERKLPTALYWAAAGLFFGLVGFMAYFFWVIRLDQRGKKPK